MNKLFTLRYLILILILAAGTSKSIGQISITNSGVAVTQNFDAMLGTSSTASLTTNQSVADNAGGTTWSVPTGPQQPN